jgi:AcrR family transcriptional regulator
MPPTPRRKTTYGTLDADRIVKAGLLLLDEDGLAAFSLSSLGRRLGVDPTAIYRHFYSKDDLTLAIGDALIGEAIGDMQIGSSWQETLRDAARRLRSTYLAHPAAAALSSFRTTRRPAELRGSDLVVAALLAAGFDEPDAALLFRAMTDFALAWAGSEASFRALEPELQRKDEQAWAAGYLLADPAPYPHLARIREHLAGLDDDDVFETIVSILLDGLEKRLRAG